MKRLGISLLALIAAGPLAAQDFALDEIVITANRTELARERTGVSVATVDREEIAQAKDTTLADTLARLPGVSVAQAGPFGNTSALRVRGADGRYLAVFVDGIKVSDPTGVQVSFDWGSLMPDGIARIELLRGSQSALWGGSAVGGVINITTLGAIEDGLHQTLTTEAGSFGTAKLSYGLTFKDAATELAFTATRLHTDGFSAFDGGAEKDGADSLRLALSFRRQVADGVTLGGSVFRQQTDQDYDGYLNWTLTDINGYRQSRTETGARAFAEVSAGNTDHVFDVTLMQIERSYDEPTAKVGDLEFSAFEGERLSFGWQATTDLGEALTLVYGADWSREKGRYSNLPQGVADTSIYGAFAQAIWAATPALDISATLRTDRNSGFGSFPTGRLALAWRASDATTLRAAYATGFRAPSIDERFGDYPGDFPFVGNPDLRPEESRSYEIGMEHAFANGLTISATAFKLDVSDRIGGDCAREEPAGPPVSPWDPPEGSPICTLYSLTNVEGVSTRKGLELTADLALSERTRLGLAYTYLDARGPAGERLKGVSRHELTVMAEAEVTDKLAAGLTLRHAAGRLLEDANTFAPITKPDYTVVDARLTYAIQDGTDAYLKVQNLTDREYQVVDGFAAPRRSVFLGLQTKF
jgi:vitamin B12 transporter